MKILRLLFIIFILNACNKPQCEPLPSTNFSSITDTKWRLIKTTDPNLSSSIDNFNFYIFQFNDNFTGSVFQVENNQEITNPVETFNYVINPQSKIIEIEYTTPSSQGSSTQNQTSTIDYSYVLTNQLSLQTTTLNGGGGSGSGISYNFVPFTGVVAPDSSCVFN